MGLSQQGLLDSAGDGRAGITKRSLQRAEKGDNLSQPALQAIANLLDNTTLEDIVLSKDGRPAAKNILKLDRLDPPSGKTVFNQLYDGVDQLKIDFDVDPDEAQAALLAELCELLPLVRQSGKTKDPWDDQLENGIYGPAAKIRTIGRLNGILHELAAADIYSFIGAYRQWQRGTKEFAGPRAVEGGAYCPRTEKQDHVEILFSGSDAAAITVKRVQWPKAQIERQILEEALECPIHPHEFVQANGQWWMSTEKQNELCTEYRRRFIEKYGVEAADPDYAGAPFPNDGATPF